MFFLSLDIQILSHQMLDQQFFASRFIGKKTKMKKVRNKINPTLNIHLFSDTTLWKFSNIIVSYVSFFEGCSSCSWPLKQRCFSKVISLVALFFFLFTTFLYVCDFIYFQHLARIFQSRLNIFFLSCPFSQLLLGISTLGEHWFLKPDIQRTEWSPWHWLSNFSSYHAFFKHLTIIFGSSLTNPGHAGSHRFYLLGLHDILIYCSLYPCLTSYRTSLPLTGAWSQVGVMEYKENGLTFHLGILAS